METTTPAAQRYQQQIQNCPAPTGDWGHVPSPFGPIEVPGFDKVRAMNDEELCAYMNTQAFVDPAGLAECTRRNTVTHYHDGKAWIWNTMEGWKAWRGANPPFQRIFDQILSSAQPPAPVPTTKDGPQS